MIALLFFHLGLPLAFFSLLVFGRPASVVHMIFRMLWIAAYTVSVGAAGGGWTWIGMWGRYLLLGLTFFGVVVGFFRALWTRLPLVAFTSWRERIDLVLAFGLISIQLGGMKQIGSRRAYQGTATTLKFPLAQRGTYAVAQGGVGEAVNTHAAMKAQSFALDITALHRSGARARGLTSPVLSDYAIFDVPVLAPCSGEVIVREDSYPDITPLALAEMDNEHLWGNRVVIACAGVSVVLAHIKRGSVTDATQLDEGSLVGRVGNSGNSSEPHLHIHAVRGRITDDKLLYRDGEPVPLVFEPGGFLTRNDIIRIP